MNVSRTLPLLASLLSFACDVADSGDDDAPIAEGSGAMDEGESEGDEGEPAESEVRVNGRVIGAEQLAQFESVLYAEIPAGDYWFDSRSGLGGPMGYPAQVWAPGPQLGDAPADASSGTTDVFYNGRELPMSEALFVAALYGIPADQIPAFAGRYILESTGDLFTEDGIYLGNLAQLAAAAGGGGTGSDGCTAVRIPSSAPNPTGVPQTIDVATGSNC